jgi:hypothetical protein
MITKRAYVVFKEGADTQFVSDPAQPHGIGRDATVAVLRLRGEGSYQAFNSAMHGKE